MVLFRLIQWPQKQPHGRQLSGMICGCGHVLIAQQNEISISNSLVLHARYLVATLAAFNTKLYYAFREYDLYIRMDGLKSGPICWGRENRPRYEHNHPCYKYHAAISTVNMPPDTRDVKLLAWSNPFLSCTVQTLQNSFHLYIHSEQCVTYTWTVWTEEQVSGRDVSRGRHLPASVTVKQATTTATASA